MEIAGVVKLVPVPIDSPPDTLANQLIVPDDAAADNVTVPDPQRLPSVVEVNVGTAETVAVNAVLGALVHVPSKIEA